MRKSIYTPMLSNNQWQKYKCVYAIYILHYIPSTVSFPYTYRDLMPSCIVNMSLQTIEILQTEKCQDSIVD